MPKIEISEKFLYSLLDPVLAKSLASSLTKKNDQHNLEQILVSAKAELDGSITEQGYIKIELNDTNRPDLWSSAGLARQLNATKGYQKLSRDYSFFNEEADINKKFIVEDKMAEIRPYVCGFTFSGITISKTILEELIQTQEKLCHNYGQKRHAVSIGIYRDELIKWPVHYTSADPDELRFVPLDFNKELSLRAILKEHPKGQEYGALIQDYDRYPLLIDTNKNILSLPPIINSAYLGAVQEGDRSLLFECTGYNLEQLMLITNIFACDCQDMGFKIRRIETVYSNTYATNKETIHTAKFFRPSDNSKKPLQKISIAPLKFQSNMRFTISQVSKLLGEDINKDQISQALKKMNVEIVAPTTTASTGSPELANKSGARTEKTIEVEVPPYRNDYLHYVDIIEDILIGLGLDTFKPINPQSFTIGRLSVIEQISRKIINTMVGLGFQEMIFPYLGSKESFIQKLYLADYWEKIEKTMIQISNPISDNYEFVRSSILPNLLEAEHVSASSPYPHRMCELGKIACVDESENYGSRTDTALGFLIADSHIGFTDLNSIVAALCYYNFIEWQSEPLLDCRFIEGRSVQLFRLDTKDESSSKSKRICIGYFGEVHPRVLESYGITMPCVAGELILDRMIV